LAGSDGIPVGGPGSSRLAYTKLKSDWQPRLNITGLIKKKWKMIGMGLVQGVGRKNNKSLGEYR
jgi:hypothetical protein